MNLDRHPYYRLLTDRERLFVKSYKEHNGDVWKAVSDAYPRTGDTSIPRISRRLLSNERISSIISWIDGQEQPTRESLIQHALIIAHTAKSDQAKVDALKLAEKILNAQDERPSREKLIQKAKETDSHAKR